MDSFMHLASEKRERIINAAMSVFATYGYHKASVMDIAKSAGISKAMVFTYFGSKLACYEFLCDELLRISLDEFNKFKSQILASDDFFERIILSLTIKAAIFKKCPSLLTFATSVYSERDSEALPIVNDCIKKGYALRQMFLSHGIDEQKFKNPAEAATAAKIAEWMSAGCADEWSRTKSADVDTAFKNFFDCIHSLKRHFYKEEYL